MSGPAFSIEELLLGSGSDFRSHCSFLSTDFIDDVRNGVGLPAEDDNGSSEEAEGIRIFFGRLNGDDSVWLGMSPSNCRADGDFH